MVISKKTVTLDNLAALGVERLAEILVALADDDAEVKRRLRLELAAQVGGDSIAAEISKRIAALKSARSSLIGGSSGTSSATSTCSER